MSTWQPTLPAFSLNDLFLPAPRPPNKQHLVGVLNEYKAAHPAAPVPLARKMDGALLAIGTLSDVLKVRGWSGANRACILCLRIVTCCWPLAPSPVPMQHPCKPCPPFPLSCSHPCTFNFHHIYIVPQTTRL